MRFDGSGPTVSSAAQHCRVRDEVVVCSARAIMAVLADVVEGRSHRETIPGGEGMLPAQFTTARTLRTTEDNRSENPRAGGSIQSLATS